MWSCFVISSFRQRLERSGTLAELAPGASPRRLRGCGRGSISWAAGRLRTLDGWRGWASRAPGAASASPGGSVGESELARVPGSLPETRAARGRDVVAGEYEWPTTWTSSRGSHLTDLAPNRFRHCSPMRTSHPFSSSYKSMMSRLTRWTPPSNAIHSLRLRMRPAGSRLCFAIRTSLSWIAPHASSGPAPLAVPSPPCRWGY